MMDKRVLIDTNILVYLTNARSDFRSAAQAAVKQEIREGAQLYVTMQILREYVRVATGARYRPKGALESDIGSALEAIRLFRRNMNVIGDDPESFERWLDIVERYKVHGSSVFDAQIAAQMLQSNITHILTNDERFSRYGNILTIIPLGATKQ